MLKNEMSVDIAKELIRDLAKGEAIKIYGQRTLLVEALELALRNRLTIYDSLFIVLAKKLGTELVTADKKQAEVAKLEGVKTIVV